MLLLALMAMSVAVLTLILFDVHGLDRPSERAVDPAPRVDEHRDEGPAGEERLTGEASLRVASRTKAQEVLQSADQGSLVRCSSSVGLALVDVEYRDLEASKHWIANGDRGAIVPSSAFEVRAHAHNPARIPEGSAAVELTPKAYIELTFIGDGLDLELVGSRRYPKCNAVELCTSDRYVAAIDVDCWAAEGFSSLQRELLINRRIQVELQWIPDAAPVLTRRLEIQPPGRSPVSASFSLADSPGPQAVPDHGWLWTIIHHNAFSPQRDARKPWQGGFDEEGAWGRIAVRLAVNTRHDLKAHGTHVDADLPVNGDLFTVIAWNEDAGLCGALTFVARQGVRVAMNVHNVSPRRIVVTDAVSGEPLKDTPVLLEVKHAGFLEGAWNRRLTERLDVAGAVTFDLLGRPEPRSSGLAGPEGTVEVTVAVPGYQAATREVALKDANDSVLEFALHAKPPALVALDATGLDSLGDAYLFPVVGDGVLLDQGFAAVRSATGQEINFVHRGKMQSPLPVIDSTVLFSDGQEFGIGVERLNAATYRAVPIASREIRLHAFPDSNVDSVGLEWGWKGNFSNWGEVNEASLQYDGGVRGTLTAPRDGLSLRLRWLREGEVLRSSVIDIPGGDCAVSLTELKVVDQ